VLSSSYLVRISLTLGDEDRQRPSLQVGFTTPLLCFRKQNTLRNTLLRSICNGAFVGHTKKRLCPARPPPAKEKKNFFFAEQSRAEQRVVGARMQFVADSALEKAGAEAAEQEAAPHRLSCAMLRRAHG